MVPPKIYSLKLEVNQVLGSCSFRPASSEHQCLPSEDEAPETLAEKEDTWVWQDQHNDLVAEIYEGLLGK